MPFGSLWLPVVASAAAVWIASALIHMVLRYHRADCRKLADEGSVAAPLAKAAPLPGVYLLPYCDPAEMRSPAARKRYEQGPVALLTVMRPGVPALGKRLAQWFGYCFLVSFVAAYVARHTLQFGQDGLTVMRITGTIAFVGFGLGSLQESIWHGVPWPNTARMLLDAAIYALVTGTLFRLLWPAA